MRFPQGLKPAPLLALTARLEAAPFQDRFALAARLKARIFKTKTKDAIQTRD
jgi:hypothetical protein